MTARFVEELGALTFAYLDLPGHEETLTVQLPGGSHVQSGAALRLTADPSAAYLFDAEGTAFPRLSARRTA